MLSHYRLVEKIGQGGMGVVWEARDVRLKRPVALKLLPADLANDRERRSRFQREAQAAAALNHPNIAAVYEVDEADGISFIAGAWADPAHTALRPATADAGRRTDRHRNRRRTLGGPPPGHRS